jgi:hypothetical protein
MSELLEIKALFTRTLTERIKKLLVNDTREIDTGGSRLSSPLCGHRLNNPIVLMGSACVAKPLDICSRGSEARAELPSAQLPRSRMRRGGRILRKTFEAFDTHYSSLGRNTQCP